MKEPVLVVCVVQGLKAPAGSLMGWDPTARKGAGKSVNKGTFKPAPDFPHNGDGEGVPINMKKKVLRRKPYSDFNNK